MRNRNLFPLVKMISCGTIHRTWSLLLFLWDTFLFSERNGMVEELDKMLSYKGFSYSSKFPRK